MTTSLAAFRGKSIRKAWHNNEWWVCITDVVEVLTDSIHASGYLRDMKRRDEQLAKG